MKIKLTDNFKGIILTRSPETTKDDIYITFQEAPSGAVAVFSTAAGLTYYRKISLDGECVIAARLLVGNTNLSVTVPDDGAGERKWICEGIRIEELGNGVCAVFPNDMDLPQKVNELFLENEQLRNNVSRLTDKLSELKKRIDSLLEGYDIT